jgi:hypothetical protein
MPSPGMSVAGIFLVAWFGMIFLLDVRSFRTYRAGAGAVG